MTLRGETSQHPEPVFAAPIEDSDREALAQARLDKYGSTLDAYNVQHVIDRIADYPEIIEAAIATRRPATGDTLTDSERDALRVAVDRDETGPGEWNDTNHLFAACTNCEGEEFACTACGVRSDLVWSRGPDEWEALSALVKQRHDELADLRARAIRALIETGRHTVDTATAALATDPEAARDEAVTEATACPACSGGMEAAHMGQPLQEAHRHHPAEATDTRTAGRLTSLSIEEAERRSATAVSREHHRMVGAVQDAEATVAEYRATVEKVRALADEGGRAHRHWYGHAIVLVTDLTAALAGLPTGQEGE